MNTMPLVVSQDWLNAHPDAEEAGVTVGQTINIDADGNHVPDISSKEQTSNQPQTEVVALTDGEFAGLPTLLDGFRYKKLPSGAIALVEKFKGRHIKEAQRQIGDKKDADSLTWVLISRMVTIAAKGSADFVDIFPEDLDEMDGSDVLVLMGEFAGASFLEA